MSVFFVVVHQRGRTQLNTQKLASHLLVEEFALYVMGGSSSKVGDSEEVQVVAETLGISRGVISESMFEKNQARLEEERGEREARRKLLENVTGSLYHHHRIFRLR